MIDDDAKRLAEMRARLAMGVLPSGDQGEFLLRLLDEALAAREWRPIETAPIETHLLLWNHRWRSPHYGVVLDDRGHVWTEGASHWLPLPEPPK